MKIGVDARPLSRSRTGIFRYLKNIINELQKLDHENLYYLYSDRHFDWPSESAHWHKRISPSLSFVPGSVWLQTEAKKMAIEDRLDVFWGPVHVLPGGLPTVVKRVVTVHDLVWRAHPQTMSTYNRLVHRMFVEKSIRQADVVIVPSESTKSDVANYLGVGADCIRVIHEGVEGNFCPLDRALAAEEIARRFRVSVEYVCTVGTLEPRKNLATLIEALGILRTEYEFGGELLIAGGKGWGRSNVQTKMLESGLSAKDVKFLGFVLEEDMPNLYSGALAFVFPSLYEGFGLPLVEAMACGAPIVAANTSSIPEVVGDAAILVGPHNSRGFAEAIFNVGSKPELRSQLSSLGVERAQLFKWQSTACETLRVLTGLQYPPVRRINLEHML